MEITITQPLLIHWLFSLLSEIKKTTSSLSPAGSSAHVPGALIHHRHLAVAETSEQATRTPSSTSTFLCTIASTSPPMGWYFSHVFKASSSLSCLETTPGCGYTSGGEDQQGDREVWSLHRPYQPVKVLFFLVLDPTPLTLEQLGAKAELQPPAHNGTFDSCTAGVHKLETGAKSGEPSPVFLGSSSPLASEAVGQLEAGDELVGMQEHPEGEIFCPQGDQTPKVFPHAAAGQQVPGAGLA